MNSRIQGALRQFTRMMRPLALRSAGKEGSHNSVIRHVGRRSGRRYETPVVALAHDDDFLIALPYGPRTDWLQNVLAQGGATIVARGPEVKVEAPEVIPMSEVTTFFGPREQRLHRQFGVESALQLRRAYTS